jgi:GntR family transcriptional repressor for pyruvate dehydrogenase complex
MRAGGRLGSAPMASLRPSERRAPLYASVQANLRDFIRREGLRPGDRLPPERELARLLGVSRTSLRQALMALRVEGLIDVRHGTGIYLARAPEDVVPPIAGALRAAHPELPALGEVRNALEALAARLAAERRNDEDLAAMADSLQRMSAEIDAGESGHIGDRLFHRAVLRAARNDVLAGVFEVLAQGAERIAQASLARPDQPPRSLTAHRLIFEAVAARDGELAQRLMLGHLEISGQISGPDG